ncbi:MAG: glycoside hydrolase family 97 protein [Candidatus Marinimicrobia bacterium]|nr:glycoside hydrolase family 97 protein [Candidatus Neomarinimicrobiota bacterium]
MKKIVVIISLMCSFLFAKEYNLYSPDQQTTVKIEIGDQISYSVSHKSQTVIDPSNIAMYINDQKLGANPEIENVERKSINRQLHPVVKVKNETIADNFNQLVIQFKNNWALVFRAYNDGIAYRFKTDFSDQIQVNSEKIEYNFSQDHKIYFPDEESMFTHQERVYKHINLSQVKDRFSSIPALVELNNGLKVLISESDLFDYPGFYLTGQKNSSTGLKAIIPHYPLETEQTSDRDVPVTEYASYLAKTSGERNFPWRMMMIADKDIELVESQLVYKLARPNQLKNTEWIEPGKVSWDWWNALNIYGVDFKAGINNQTYKYYIDFAAKYDLKYIILDEGWSKPKDLFAIRPEIDVKELVEYGRKKNVGIILWVVWKSLDDQLDRAMQQFEDWGIKGIKVDFMQRDDQEMVNYYWKIAREAAKRHLLVDFHGSYKPAGLRRAYPNVLTREGVRGLEQCKWSEDDGPERALILPFIRMAAGPMDYTPGAMINATKNNFHPFFSRPMSQGTRCQQLAMYVVYESPLQMLADSPSNYYKETECMDFLSRVPTTWDKTIVLDGKIGEYIIIARKSGQEWYVGAMTDWTVRDLNIGLDFLENGNYNIDIFKDGPNAHRNAIDFTREQKKIKSGEKLKIHLAPGGGWAARIY